MGRNGNTTSPKTGATAASLLRTAAELMGSNKSLAERLGISQSMLIKYMSGMSEVPAEIVVRAADIVQ